MLAEEWSRARRSGEPLALAMLDVDWFKGFNDHYGHQAGDDCLRLVAQVFAATVHRASDKVARYGGEEFALVAPGTNEASMLAIAKTICETLHGQGLAHASSPFGVLTASIGVAVVRPAQGETWELLLKNADTALYQAKAGGRHQARLFASPD